jgi:hypothetical protein
MVQVIYAVLEHVVLVIDDAVDVVVNTVGLSTVEGILLWLERPFQQPQEMMKGSRVEEWQYE